MSLINPTLGYESQFLPIAPIDSKKFSYSVNTFNILPDIIYTNPSSIGNKLLQFNPSKPIDSGKFSYARPTFNLKLEGPADLTYGAVLYENFSLKNPTNIDNNLVKPVGWYPVTPNLIVNQFAPVFASSLGIKTFNLVNEQLSNNNPTYEFNSLSKPQSQWPGQSAVTKNSIITQFASAWSKNDPYDTFDLKDEQLTVNNPTIANNKLIKPKSPFTNTEVNEGTIKLQYPFETALSYNGGFDQRNEQLLISNPTNPANTLAKPTGDYAVTTKIIQDQFIPKDSVQLKDILGFAANVSGVSAIPKINKFTTILSGLSQLDTNTSLSSNIIEGKLLLKNKLLGKLVNSIKSPIGKQTLNLLGASNNNLTSQYATLQLSQLYKPLDVTYSDFRSRRRIGLLNKLVESDSDEDTVITMRHGEAASNKSATAKNYMEASKDRRGVYSEFNIENTYGLSTVADAETKNDFTTSKYFFGDYINILGLGQGSLDGNHFGTKDFIKFFFNGPDGEDLMVFRATISSLRDSFNPQWTPQQMIGRADPNYHYSGYSRDMDVEFIVYASDRNELSTMWEKLNGLAGYTAPSYDSYALVGPWLRITIGDLYVQQPAIISSLSYTLHDTDTTWEINIEEDPDIYQSPHKISVSIGFSLITNNLPQKGGSFYSLIPNQDPYTFSNNSIANIADNVNETGFSDNTTTADLLNTPYVVTNNTPATIQPYTPKENTAVFGGGTNASGDWARISLT